MTSPTQAQIERLVDRKMKREGYEINGPMREVVRDRIMEKYGVAAAQVGEPNQKNLASYIRTIGQSIEVRTIERCAQVAEQHIEKDKWVRSATAKEIAAAIRKLKDKT